MPTNRRHNNDLNGRDIAPTPRRRSRNTSSVGRQSADKGTNNPRANRQRKESSAKFEQSLINAQSVQTRSKGRTRRTPSHSASVTGVKTSQVSKPYTKSDTSRMRHAKQSTIAEAVAHKSKRRIAAIIIGVVIVAILGALAVGIYTFFKTTDSNLGRDTSDVKSALVAVEDDNVRFILCTADLSIPKLANQADESQCYMLTRLDTESKTITYVTIPQDLKVRLADNTIYKLKDVKAKDGNAGVISALSSQLGVPINDFISTNADDIASLVNLLGGVPIDIKEEIDDPKVSTKVIFAGEQTLDGEEALNYLRATNVTGGFDSTAQNRVTFTSALLDKGLSSNGFDFANLVSEASKYINTDLSTSDLLALGEKLRPASEIQFYSCILPTYTNIASDGVTTELNLYRDRWQPMLSLINEGQNPKNVNGLVEEISKTDVTVEIRNGTMMNGVAARLGEILTSDGYTVLDVGNVDDGTIYPETLIVYTQEQFAQAGQTVLDDVGCGRLVNGGDFYSSNANVIVIIGLNYIPPA